jgi:DNA-binding XRE family transcriptional regulator
MKRNHEEKIIIELVNQFKSLRLKSGLSHNKLAKQSDVTRSGISQIEAGKRRPTLLVCLKIAHGLDENLGEIIAECERKVYKNK